MKIAIVRPSSSVIPVGSYNCQELGLSKALLDLGVSTDIYMVGRLKKAEITEIAEDGRNSVRVIRLPFIALPGQQAIMFGLFPRLSMGEYDIIQTHEDSQITSVAISIAFKNKKTKVVLCQGMYSNYSGFHKKVFQIIFDLTLGKILRNYVDGCIAKTDLAKKYLIGKGYAQEVSICNIGLDTEALLGEKHIPWHERLNIPTSSSLLLYVGKVEKRRNVDFLIALLSNLRRIHPFYLVIVGDGPEIVNCKKLACDHGVDDYVVFVGKLSQSELPSLYKACLCFLLPSSYEIYGMVILEAMYFGLPVISTASAGSLEVITNNTDGIIIYDLDVDKWAASTITLLESKEKLKKMKIDAEDKIKARYLWNVAVKAFYKAYVNILQSNTN